MAFVKIASAWSSSQASETLSEMCDRRVGSHRHGSASYSLQAQRCMVASHFVNTIKRFEHSHCVVIGQLSCDHVTG